MHNTVSHNIGILERSAQWNKVQLTKSELGGNSKGLKKLLEINL